MIKTIYDIVHIHYFMNAVLLNLPIFLSVIVKNG